ncbi:hypothetical protein RUM44_000587 [Polyplax serrata]|uniref:dTMP kinase n=1 Tax=Polyplax serrata TaxID=468196 RepID=A0ABR1B6V4_POLSC
MKGSGIKRGALIVFEGCDKAGKTTQCRKLVDKLRELGVTAQFMQFPDRSTATGKIINNYLTNKEELPDQAVHLLFSANRWESQSKMRELLQEGVTLIVDRYSYSGVAYSAAKQNMNFEWCYKPEIGLPKPDLVFLLHVPMNFTHNRSGFGEERYEKMEFQQIVLNNYMKMTDDTWKLIDTSRNIEEVHEELLHQTRKTIEKACRTELQSLT